jgi:hypothetical protein
VHSQATSFDLRHEDLLEGSVNLNRKGISKQFELERCEKKHPAGTMQVIKPTQSAQRLITLPGLSPFYPIDS